ncbi:patatin-like phospholipase domain-containing protein 7 isoform X3 [Dendronephthya gigantea]|uniref:patatin-like phospholipase domain-containing protein 7 isoform X3 n=1 Tax=Dendronephthya gigantea TaxID=151771 RepID=UPI00106D68B6|nr:patatin-like phospholipase domain-containing protein 7 isoform X3 [Dendronephthya gigantea]
MEPVQDFLTRIFTPKVDFSFVWKALEWVKTRLYRVLHLQEQEPSREVKEPPPAFLEADWKESEEAEQRLPSEVVYMLKSVRVFGHFEKPLFIELCKHIETKFLPANTVLSSEGVADSNIYVVQSGQLVVYIVEKDGTKLALKNVTPGNSVFSMLGILDVLTGMSPTYEHKVRVVASVDSYVLKLPSKAFQTVFDHYPESLVRLVQVIMLRLQQVTMMALHNFLGLTQELINYDPEDMSKMSSIHSFSNANKPSTVTTSEKENTKDTPSKNGPAQAGKKVPRSVSVVAKAGSSLAKSAPVQIPDSMRRSYSLTFLREKMSDGEITDETSDFAAACGRARAFADVASRPKFDMGSSTSPEPSPNALDTSRFDFPIQQKDSDTDKHRLEKGGSFYEDEVLKTAKKDIAAFLGLGEKDENLLDDVLCSAVMPKGTILVTQGELDCSVYFLISGCLQVSQKDMDATGENVLYVTHPGEFVGSLSVITGEPSLFTIKAVKFCQLAVLSKTDIYSILLQRPRVILNLSSTLTSRLTPLVRNIDYALDWVHMEAGRAIYRQGDESDCLYIVLNGRLRSVVTQNKKKELVGEHGRGELVGVVEALTQNPRMATVHAVRDTEVAILPDGLLNVIKHTYPQVVSRLIHLLGERILSPMKAMQPDHSGDASEVGTNLGTIAIVQASDDVPLNNFAFELSLALNSIGPTLLLTSFLVQSKLGTSALDSMHEYRLSSWLGQQEDLHRLVVYQADHYMSAWTKRCIRQADLILIVALGDKEPHVGQLEMQMENMQVRAQKELVLLHRALHKKRITRTVEWLNARGWISAHHHIRCPRKVLSRKSLVEKYLHNPDNYEIPGRHSDFARLARRLTGTSIGLVLGGGGARGISHVGIIQALHEQGIPIDMVAGTSIGAFVGAVYATEADPDKTVAKCREWSMGMTSTFKMVLELTYPFTSFFSGNGFNASIRSVFGEKQIEDLLIPYFNITTDITSSCMRVHSNGSLWRYVRASMSLAGYMPPLCDPIDGHMLLDGGYCNNLPADVMKSKGANTIIAVDVGSEYPAELTNYGDHLSGWWLLWNKWNPFSEKIYIPNMAEIQSRLAYISCIRQLEDLKENKYCEYLRPPINRYHTLEFGKFNEILKIGFDYGQEIFQEWAKNKKSDIFPDLAPVSSTTRPELHEKRPISNVKSISDFARLVSRVENPHNPLKFITALPEGYETSDEEDGGAVSEPHRTGSLGDHEGRLGGDDGEHFGTAFSSTDEAEYESDDLHIRRRNGSKIFRLSSSELPE